MEQSLVGSVLMVVHFLCSCGFKPSNAEWREVIAAAVEAAMSGDGAITAQEVSLESSLHLACALGYDVHVKLIRPQGIDLVSLS